MWKIRGLVYHVENRKKKERKRDKWVPNVYEDPSVRIKVLKDSFKIMYEEERKENECCVCLTRESSVGVLHSGTVHKCLCNECVLTLMNMMTAECPLCRDPIESYVEVY